MVSVVVFLGKFDCSGMLLMLRWKALVEFTLKCLCTWSPKKITECKLRAVLFDNTAPFGWVDVCTCKCLYTLSYICQYQMSVWINVPNYFVATPLVSLWVLIIKLPPCLSITKKMKPKSVQRTAKRYSTSVPCVMKVLKSESWYFLQGEINACHEAFNGS